VLRSAKRFKAATDHAVAFQGFHPIYNLGTTRKSLRSQKVQNSIRKIASVAALLAAQRVFGRPKTPLFGKSHEGSAPSYETTTGTAMTMELAATRFVSKPWGAVDLRPWSTFRQNGDTIGELWFQRRDQKAPESALLLKLLFTTQPLSIQVHPDDSFARLIGIAHGKAEAWYVLAAKPGAKVALGLKRQLTSHELRTSIDEGSIAGLVQWHDVEEDDVIYVPGGTIHALGAGLVVAEIQQRSDTTFRLFDFGRQRELHVDQAVAAAKATPPEPQSPQRRLTDARTLLVATPEFVFERIDLTPESNWALTAEQETWMIIIAGHARICGKNASVGVVVFLDVDSTCLEVGSAGLRGLLAYPGSQPDLSLLRLLEAPIPRPPTATEARS
jgi:mannose-6-phosphate isomerase